MPVPTMFHSRTSKLCTSNRWKDWAGYFAVCSYDTFHEPEYFAIRHAAGLIDVTPLFKYEVYGPDAAAFLSRLTVKNLAKLEVGRVTYLCWCDDDGKVVDDGTVSRLEDDYFRLTAAEPAFSWLERFRRGYDVTIEDSSDRIGALALQGPTSREILKQITDADIGHAQLLRQSTVQPRRHRGLDHPHRLHRRSRLRDLGRTRGRRSGLRRPAPCRRRLRSPAGRDRRPRRVSGRGRLHHERRRLLQRPPLSDRAPQELALRARARLDCPARTATSSSAATPCSAKRPPVPRNHLSGSTSAGPSSRRSSPAMDCRPSFRGAPGGTANRSTTSTTGGSDRQPAAPGRRP